MATTIQWKEMMTEWIARVARRPCLYLGLHQETVKPVEDEDIWISYHRQLADDIEWMPRLEEFMSWPDSTTFAHGAATHLWFEGWALIACESEEEAERLFDGVRDQMVGGYVYATIYNADGTQGTDNT